MNTNQPKSKTQEEISEKVFKPRVVASQKKPNDEVMRKGQVLFDEIVDDLRDFRGFLKENWQTVAGALVTTAVNAYLAQKTKTKKH